MTPWGTVRRAGENQGVGNGVAAIGHVIILLVAAWFLLAGVFVVVRGIVRLLTGAF
jgi:hypothetical protein